MASLFCSCCCTKCKCSSLVCSDAKLVDVHDTIEPVGTIIFGDNPVSLTWIVIRLFFMLYTLGIIIWSIILYSNRFQWYYFFIYISDWALLINFAYRRI